MLKTYDTERRQIAQELIDFDYEFSRLFSGRLSRDISGKQGVDLQTFRDVFEKGTIFSSGITVNYGPSVTVVKLPEQVSALANTTGKAGTEQDSKRKSLPVGKQWLAKNVPIGMLMPSYKVLNQADARPWHLQELLPSNGTWRILVFAGDLRDTYQLDRYEALGQGLSSRNSFLHRYTPREEKIDSVFEVITIHSAPRTSVELLSLPEIFLPFSEEYGWDYWKVFVDDDSYHEGHGHAYENYGIDSRTGCVIVVRPDEHVSWVGELEDVEDMEQFFMAFMRQQNL